LASKWEFISFLPEKVNSRATSRDSLAQLAFLKGGAHSGFNPLPLGWRWLFNEESIRRLFMNLTISGHHLEVTPALRTYVTGKLDRITRHFDQVVDVKVLLTVEKQKEKEKRQRAECNIHVKGSDLFAESAHEDLYAAVDELVDKLDRQVIKHKDRITDHHHSAPKRMM
jgi:putative sigma-54 modulation protein